MRGVVRIASPDTLETDSISDLKFIFESRDDRAYHIRSVYLSPTWDLMDRSRHIVDKTVFPETKKIIDVGQTHFPPALGGKQGYRIGFEVSPYLEGEMEYEVVWAGPVRKSISNSTPIESVIHIPKDRTVATEIQEVLALWGFQATTVNGAKEGLDHIRGSDPSCFFGVLSHGSNEATVNSVENMAAAAVEEGVWPLIFTDNQSHAEHLSQEAIVVECDMSNCRDIERESSLALHTVRFSVEGGFSSLLFDRFTGELKQTVESTTIAGRAALRRVIETLALDAILRESGGYKEVDEFLRIPSNEFTGHSEDSSRGRVDLTHLANSDPQVLDICLFYQDDPIWYEDQWYEEYEQARNQAFTRVVEEDLLPESYGRFSLHWSKDISAFTIHNSLDDTEKVYESGQVKKLEVEVPKKGSYAIVPENGVISWISFDQPFSGIYEESSNRQIGGNILKIFEDSGKVESITVGCPTENKTLNSSIREFITDKDQWGLTGRTWYRD